MTTYLVIAYAVGIERLRCQTAIGSGWVGGHSWESGCEPALAQGMVARSL